VDVDLNAKPIPQYEAVSYSWRKDILRGHVNLLLSNLLPNHFSEYQTEEQDVGNRFILCNGKALHIQHNLYDFLVRLREKRRGLPLWIDAICIDQSEKDEAAKNEKYGQLKLMEQIYKSAQAVLVWLGESDNISSSFPDTLKPMRPLDLDYENYQTENDVLRLQKKPFPFRLLLESIGLDETSWRVVIARGYKFSGSMNGVVRLVNRDYFQRAWVVQEIVLAKELYFFVGSMEITSELLLNGIKIVSAMERMPIAGLNSHSDRSGHLAIPHILRAREDRLKGQPWSLDDFLFICRDRQAFRAEDKIFSVLGLAGQGRVSRLTEGVKTKDGSILLDRLYVNCAEVLAEDTGWPYVLSLVGTGAAESKDLPSWVPDLRSPLYPKPLWFYGCTHFKAATSVQAAPTISNLGNTQGHGFLWSLLVSVTYIDEITQVGESQNELDMTQALYAEGHILDLVSKLGRYYAGTKELSMDAFMRTLTADVFKRDENAAPLPQLRREFVKWIDFTFSEIEDSYSKNLQRVARLNARALNVSDVRDCAEINSTHLEISATIDAFLRVHDTSAFPMSEVFGRHARPDTLVGGTIEIDPEEEDDPLDEGFNMKNLINATEKEFRGVLSAINNYTYKHRRIFRTKERNLVGMGHRDIRIGDVVCLVAGAPTPFIFRRVAMGTTNAGQLGDVRLVGGAYLHGTMYGELVEEKKLSFETVRVV
jgi:hypothetical protein